MILKNELEKKFELNKMQEEASENNGENLIFNAPTGSGKTEAVLLSIPEGKKVSFLLPTITSSIFMYRRLAESGLFNVEVKTSLLKEKSLGKGLLNVQIHTPDPALLEFLENGEKTNKKQMFMLFKICMLQCLLIVLINMKKKKFLLIQN